MEKFKKITDAEIKTRGVQALADRPNAASQYGQGGMSAGDLKKWFDNLANLLASRLNELYDAFEGDIAKYIHIAMGDVTDLGTLVEAINDGSFARNLLKVLPSAALDEDDEENYVTLQSYINAAARKASDLSERLGEIDRNKLDQVVSLDTYRRAYMVDSDGQPRMIYIVEDPLPGAIPMYVGDGQINVAIPVAPSHAANKNYVDTQDRFLGSKIEISIDPSTFVMTLVLKNSDGSILSTSTVDLPLESAVIGGEYSDGYLTLKFFDGETRIKISDIIDGLVSSTVYNTDMDDMKTSLKETNDHIDSFSLELALGKVYAHAAFSAEHADTARNYTKGGKIDMRFRDCDKRSATDLLLDLSDDYKLSVALKNRAGNVVSHKEVDLPMQSLISSAVCKNGILTLTLQNGHTVDINVSDIVSGLVPETREINGHQLNGDIKISATDVGAYPKDEVYNKTQMADKLSVMIDEAMRDTSGKYGDGSAVGYAYYSSEAEEASGYVEGGLIDIELTNIKKRLKVLEA